MKKQKILALIFGLSALIAINPLQAQAKEDEQGDNRQALNFSQSEKDFVLNEMREFLSSVQQILAGVNNNDMQQVAKAAKAVGRAAAGHAPAGLRAKLPMQFRKWGFDTHGKFDQLALDAADFGDKDQVISQLSKLMENCVACHASFRIVVNK